ncbi:MAG: 2,3-bisphosphoglycerate-independent phosphoglycerate mutase [Patescibacteria group bacterium]|nr:2,3-bisphosphoglycerate-independent phosphoglycerate mutase [Patescibacteria group bacterium]
MQKILFVISDGIPDRPIRELGNKTPLEVAKTPNLDRIAVDGISGMMHTVDIGVRPGSDTAHLSLFGYDPHDCYTGRGPYECAGIGMQVNAGDVAFRANAGTVDEQGIVTDRRAGRIESTRDVIDALGKITISGVEFDLQPSLAHRIGLVIRGKNLSPNISDQDPHKTDVPVHTVKPLDHTPEAKFTADVMNQFTKLTVEKLSNSPFNRKRKESGKLPANIVLFRGAGSIPHDLLSFKDKYNLRAAFIAGGPMYRGIAKILGMTVAEFAPSDGVTGLPNSNLDAKVRRALELLPDYDIIFVHFKAADSLAEDGNFRGKIEFIEKIDRAIKPLAERNDFITVITADHTTACGLKTHTADPVPVTIKGEGVRTDDINAYTERECAKGRLGTIRGQNLMPILIDLMGLAELYGA